MPVLLLLGMSGCVMSRTVRVGEPQPATQPCKVEIKRLAFQDAIKSYRQVATICANITDDALYREGRLADSIRGKIQSQACAVGGEMVTPIASCSLGKVDGVELGVFRKL